MPRKREYKNLDKLADVYRSYIDLTEHIDLILINWYIHEICSENYYHGQKS